MRPQDLKKLKKEKLIADYYLVAANLYKNSLGVLKLQNDLYNLSNPIYLMNPDNVETTARSLKITQTRVKKYDAALGAFREEIIRRKLENEVEFL